MDETELLDVGALRRRTLLTAVLSFGLYLTLAFVVSALDVSSLWLLPGVTLLYVLVVRPLMRPVRAAIALRRRVAYQAFLAQRAEEDRG